MKTREPDLETPSKDLILGGGSAGSISQAQDFSRAGAHAYSSGMEHGTGKTNQDSWGNVSEPSDIGKHSGISEPLLWE